MTARSKQKQRGKRREREKERGKAANNKKPRALKYSHGENRNE